MANDENVIKFLGDLAQQHKGAAALSDNYGEGLFKLGRLTRATRGHNPPLASGDASIYRAHDLMNRRVREMYANNSSTKRTVDVLRDLIVGSGIQAFSDPFDASFGWDLQRRPTGEIGRSLDYALESDEGFEDWATDPKKCDVAGNLIWPEMQALTVSESSQVGDIFLVYVYPRVPTGDVPFQVQVIEREQLDTMRDRPASKGVNQILNGIEIDADGYEVGAWFFEAHPGDGYAAFSAVSSTSTFVPASRYTHFYKKMRPSQHIGATWLHAQGQTVIDRGQYLETEIRTAVKHALFLLAYQTDTPGSMGVGLEPDDGDLSGYDIALGQNPIAAEIGRDEKLELIESNRPNDSANNFFNLIDHDHAGAANLSYYSQTGRFNETNYGGFRGAMNLEDAQMQPIKDALALKVVLPVRQRWNDLASAVGMLKTMSPRDTLGNENGYRVSTVSDLAEIYSTRKKRIAQSSTNYAPAFVRINTRAPEWGDIGFAYYGRKNWKKLSPTRSGFRWIIRAAAAVRRPKRRRKTMARLTASRSTISISATDSGALMLSRLKKSEFIF